MEKEIGYIEHYFNHLGVAAVKITKGNLKVGDKIHVKGMTTDFTEQIKSMELEHGQIKEANPGDDIGVKMEGKCREHDKVYLVL